MCVISGNKGETCVNELQLGLKCLLCLITTKSLIVFDSAVVSTLYFIFLGIQISSEWTGLSGLFLNIYCISSSVLLYVECWKCYILYRMHYVISDLLFLYNQ